MHVTKLVQFDWTVVFGWRHLSYLLPAWFCKFLGQETEKKQFLVWCYILQRVTACVTTINNMGDTLKKLVPETYTEQNASASF